MVGDTNVMNNITRQPTELKIATSLGYMFKAISLQFSLHVMQNAIF